MIPVPVVSTEAGGCNPAENGHDFGVRQVVKTSGHVRYVQHKLTVNYCL